MTCCRSGRTVGQCPACLQCATGRRPQGEGHRAKATGRCRRIRRLGMGLEQVRARARARVRARARARARVRARARARVRVWVRVQVGRLPLCWMGLAQQHGSGTWPTSATGGWAMAGGLMVQEAGLWPLCRGSHSGATASYRRDSRGCHVRMGGTAISVV